MSRRITPADAIFLALADVPPGDREAALQQHCAGDVRLRAEVEALLAAVDAPDESFLDPDELPSLDMTAVDGPLRPGTILGDYLVLHAIGSGAMGVVYAAQQDRPRRTVAIKVLRRGFRHPEILKRFEREAEVLGRLQHPGIAQVLAFHQGSRRLPAHLVMELIEGPSITEHVRAHALPPAGRVELLAELCDAVQHAHDKGIVHRDLKPANVLVADGRPKVLDFGIARATGLDLRSSIQTSHGQILGTLAYMSPEQLRGVPDAIDGRSDVYALGVLLYRLMTGRLPFDVTDSPLVEAVQHILQHDAPLAHEVDPQVNASLSAIAARAMARESDARYQTASALGADLRAFLDGQLPAPHAAGSPGPREPAYAGEPLVAVSPDGRHVAITLASGAVLIMDVADGATIARIPNR